VSVDSGIGGKAGDSSVSFSMGGRDDRVGSSAGAESSFMGGSEGGDRSSTSGSGAGAGDGFTSEVSPPNFLS